MSNKETKPLVEGIDQNVANIVKCLDTTPSYMRPQIDEISKSTAAEYVVGVGKAFDSGEIPASKKATRVAGFVNASHRLTGLRATSKPKEAVDKGKAQEIEKTINRAAGSKMALSTESAASIGEGLVDTIKKVGAKVMDKLHPSDEDLLKDLQKKSGVPQTAQHGKPSMAKTNEAVTESCGEPPIEVRSLYTKSYAKYGGTGAKAKAAQQLAYGEVEKKHGKDMADKLKSFHAANMTEGHINEADQQLQELSKSTLASYIEKRNATGGASKHINHPYMAVAGAKDRLHEVNPDNIKVHDLSHLDHGDAYDATQTNSNIKDGDVLKVHGGSAVMVSAWPTMVNGNSEHFHTAKWDHPSMKPYAKSRELALNLHHVNESANAINEATHVLNHDVWHEGHGVTKEGTPLKHVGDDNYEVQSGKNSGKVLNIKSHLVDSNDKSDIATPEKQLAQLKAQFDPNYEYSDDYTHWSKHHQLRQKIQDLQHRLKESVDMVSEGKDVNMKSWMRAYDRREDNNFHSENAVALAKLVGNEHDIKTANAVLKNHIKLGYLSDEDSEKRRDLHKRLWPLAIKKHKEQQGVTESIDMVSEESLTAGMRLVSKHGDGEHTAKVYKDPDSNEYQAHFYKGGKHMGEGPVYYTDDKQDAKDTAEHTIKGLNSGKYKVSESVEQIDELQYANMNPKDLHSFLVSHGWTSRKSGGGGDHMVYTHPKASKNISVPRHKHLNPLLVKGIMKLATVSESVDQIDELKSETLTSYKEGAKKSADELTAAGKHKEATKRWGNIMKATGKQIEQTTKAIRAALNPNEPKQMGESMISYSDFTKKIDAHRKAGTTVKDAKYTDKAASYTTVDADGNSKKITHTPSGVKQEHLGQSK